MGHTTKPRINGEDINLFKAIAKHGFVDMQYVLHFLYKDNKKRTVEERILQLTKFRYLYVQNTFIPPEFTADNKTGYKIITLGSVGLYLMKCYGYDVINNISTLKIGAAYRKYHQVQVATVCDSVETAFASSDSKFEVYKILNERESCLDGASNQPDAIILFRPKDHIKKAYILVFVEIERSYASDQAVERKLRSYKVNIFENRYIKKLKLPIIEQRILFVAQTPGEFSSILEKIKNCEYNDKLDILVTRYCEVCKHPESTIYVHNETDEMVKLLSNIKEKDKGDKNG